MGSCFCHISTTIPPMDLKPLAFASFRADAPNTSNEVPTVACKQYLDHTKQTQVKRLCRLYCTTSTTMWDLVFAICLQLYHLWTSNHLHSLHLVHMHTMHMMHMMHTMQYRLWPVSTTWTTPTQPNPTQVKSSQVKSSEALM